MSLSTPHEYDITEFVRAGQDNEIAIRVYNGIENRLLHEEGTQGGYVHPRLAQWTEACLEGGNFHGVMIRWTTPQTPVPPRPVASPSLPRRTPDTTHSRTWFPHSSQARFLTSPWTLIFVLCFNPNRWTGQSASIAVRYKLIEGTGFDGRSNHNNAEGIGLLFSSTIKQPWTLTIQLLLPFDNLSTMNYSTPSTIKNRVFVQYLPYKNHVLVLKVAGIFG